MGSSAEHTQLVHDILAACGALPGVVIGANASGRATYVAESGRKFVVPYGWLSPGGPDLLAVVAPLGRAVALEAKTGDAEATREQRECHAALRAVGVIVEIVRSVEEARAAIERARVIRRCMCDEPRRSEWCGLPFCSRCGVMLSTRAEDAQQRIPETNADRCPPTHKAPCPFHPVSQFKTGPDPSPR